LKDENRKLQQNIFQLNKELNKLNVDFTEMKIRNNETVSQELGKIEVVQKKIHALEEALVAQAQLEEAVQRARERVAAQTAETVKQREKNYRGSEQVHDHEESFGERHRGIETHFQQHERSDGSVPGNRW